MGAPCDRTEIGRAVEATTGERTTEAFRKRGTLRLFIGQTTQAVQELEEASFLKPGDGRLSSDLAVAYLSRARERSNPFDLILALSATDRALRVSRSLPEARFNHALALEKLHLREAARLAWEDYLELDATSDWSREARARHAALVEPSEGEEWEEQREKLNRMAGREEEIGHIVERFPQEVRQYTEEALLGSWAGAVKGGRKAEAARLLAVARRIGAALVTLHGDWMSADAVAAIDSSAGDPRRQAALVDGHASYWRARELHASMQVSEARPLFEKARRSFALGRSPVETLADLYLAVGQYQHFLYASALGTLRRITAERKNSRYPGLLAKAYWTLGLVLLVDGRPADAIGAYQKSRIAATKAGALEDVAGVHAILGESFRYLGRPIETWKHLYEALTLTAKIRTPRRLTAVLFETAEACSAAGEPAAELYFRDEAIRVTRKAGEPTSLANALLHRAWTLHRLQDLEGAAKDLAEARWITEQVRDEPQRLRLQAYLLIVESEMSSRRDPEDAVQALTWALDFFNERENHYFLSRLYLARARAELALQHKDRAEGDLQRGIEEYELQRRQVTEEPLRISFFDQADGLFDEMVRLQVRYPGGMEKAFDYAERERARALLDRLRPLTARQRAPVIEGTLRPWTSREIQRAIPKDVAIVEYAVSEDRLFAWVVRSDGIGFADTKVESQALDRLVERLRASLSGSRVVSASLPAANLYDLLIRPVLPQLQGKNRIVFVPDGSLNAVPFAALLDRTSGRFLVQDRVLAVAPSATVYVHALGRDRVLSPSAAPTALLLANPRFKRELAPDLRDLPQAEREAAAVAALFPGSELLSGDRATRSALLSIAGRHQILHFGGHAVLNRDFPLLSHLLMASEDGEDSGLLYAHQLYGIHLERTRLAVLAGCNTASGPIGGEGPLSFARAFLAMGVPGVIASLWQVEDRETIRLLQVFYERLRQGDDAAAALRHAQLAQFSSRDPARPGSAWAAFVLFGSGFSPSQ